MPVPPEVVEAMQRLRAESVSANTRAAQISDWTIFTRWCDRVGRRPLPAGPELVGWFLTEKSTEVRPDGRPAYAPSTLTRWVASINTIHSLAGHPKPGQAPAVREILRGIARTRATPPARREPLLTEDVRTIVEEMRARSSAGSWPDRVAERRDSALLLIGLTGAMRRSELAGLLVSDVRPHRADGLYVTIRRSKTDQAAAGRTVTLPYGASSATCPVCAYWRWRQVVDVWDDTGRGGVSALLSGPTDDHTEHCCRGRAGTSESVARPLFRRVHRTGGIGTSALSGQAIASMIQRRARQAGYAEEFVAMLGGHSLRAGFVTQAVRNAASAEQIMTQSGHTDQRMIALYSRQHAGLHGNAVTALGL
ncbi:tyrosine-type recombinase/integrase [Rhodococcus sp. D2-41]|uniref:Tyrosine-type recombinase/integrase n=2 Tax=Speluncibacter jeojiensis TaxID=2710754 RepID=A0A9X4M565_9ACTN|nr:tyrosine-type recombinase/integrase [Rhodococcus sp. D2-41]MDG3011095.1 tyrosine-type recombinase/integrase [Rhodococcus sp. D2-41]MDG3017215.1 tyrosine-type recombinase/integrase [Corynebacteriales bacterium D3-21]